MKNIFLLFLSSMVVTSSLHSQDVVPDDRQKKEIYSLIEKYSQAREKKDTLLLKEILTTDIDQLVSTGEWRNGIEVAVTGMLNSSATSPGTRTLKVERMKFLNPQSAVVDCKYEIQETGGSSRKMWSTFIVVSARGIWKISAIRNMLPAGP